MEEQIMACEGPLGWVACKAGDAAGQALGSGAESLGEVMMGAWDAITKEFLTSWLDVGLLVDLDAGSVTWLTDQLQVISILLATVGIMIAALWTMVHHRGEKAAKVAKSMFTVILVSTAGVGLLQVVMVGGDAFCDWILDSAGVTVDSRANLPTAVMATNPGLAILAGIFGIIATMIQWGIMLVRSALLPLLVGVWPVAAAASMIGGAEQAFSKITTWIVAFALYKPVAAIVYAYAWKTKSGEDGMGGVINGLVLIVLAVVALPAMMRLISPGTSALGGSGGGGMALAGGAALVGAGVAAGTAVLSGGGSAAAGGAAKTAGTTKSTQTATSTAKGTGSSGPPSSGGSDSGGSDSGGGSTAGGSGSGGTGSGTVGGESTAGGTGAETVGADSGSGSTGSGTVGGDSAAGGTGAETVGADTAAQGASQPTNAETGGSGAAGGTATSGTSSGPGGDSAGVGTPAPGTSEPTTADTGATPSSESAGSSGSAGTAAGTGAPAGAPETTPAYPNTNNAPSKAKDAGGAAAKSLGQAIADGTKDADGKDVIGE